MNKLLLGFCTLILLASCRHDPKIEFKDTPALVIDLSKNPVENPVENIAVNVTCIPLENKQNSRLSGVDGISRIVAIKNRLYLLDKNFTAIKVYNEDGKYLFDVGKLGIGNEKFLKVEDLIYNSNRKTLWVLCNSPKKIVEYSLDGKFIRIVKLPFFASGLGIVSPDLFCYYVNQNKTALSVNKNLLFTDTNNTVKQKFFDFPLNVKSSLEFTGGIYATQNKIYFNPPFERVYYQIDKTKISATYQINFGKEDLTVSPYERPFVGKSFVEIGDYVGFDYQKKGNYSFLLYDKKAKKTFTDNMKLSPLNFLFNSRFASQDNDKLMLLLEPKYIQEMLKANEATIARKFPGIYDKLKVTDATNKEATSIAVIKFNLKHF